MTKEPTYEDLGRIVRNEVHYCVSHLVATLAQGYGAIAFVAGDKRTSEQVAPLRDLTEQAFELASPIPDYEEAAIQEGWTGPHKDEFGATYFEDKSDGQTWACADWQELCAEHDIEPYDRDVYEHWIVSDWLADKLAARGEKVDKDFAGMTVWARTCTGQGIAADSVIADVWRDAQRSIDEALSESDAGNPVDKAD